MQKNWQYRNFFFVFLFCFVEALSCPGTGCALDRAQIKDRTVTFEASTNHGLIVEEFPLAFIARKDAYSLLIKELGRYRTIAANGGCPEMQQGILLKKGVRNDEVAVLRRRLAVSGDLIGEQKESDVFDVELERAVINFQACHGLKTDGAVGPLTLKELNVPASARADQILVNLERLGWFADSLGERYVYVNIANYRLDVMENGRSVLSMKVIVGKPYWDTPVFSAKMTYLIVNPSWNVPESIVAEEILPHIKKDPDYLTKQNITVFKDEKGKAAIIDPASINWQNMPSKEVPFRFRQQPGPLNPLGKIKFMFPNKFNVYLHDTPTKGLFDKGARAFSHGCIRIEKPLELAQYLLKDNPKPMQVDLDKAVAAGEERMMNIARPIDVHVVYLTAWPDDEGGVQFRNDVYGRDAKLLAALRDKSSKHEGDSPAQEEPALPR